MNNAIKLTYIILVMVLAVACNGPLDYPDAPVSRGSIDFVAEIEKETALLDDQSINSELKGLVAFINVINRDNVAISGDDIIEALNHFKPEFSSENKDLYKSLGEIETVFNKDGKIYVVVKEDNSIDIDKIRVRSGSNLIVINSSNLPEFKLEVKEGITVGWKFVQFDLNFINVEPETGILTVNYGWDKIETVDMNELLEE